MLLSINLMQQLYSMYLNAFCIIPLRLLALASSMTVAFWSDHESLIDQTLEYKYPGYYVLNGLSRLTLLA